jgi:predicted transcriptional regulator
VIELVREIDGIRQQIVRLQATLGEREHELDRLIEAKVVVASSGVRDKALAILRQHPGVVFSHAEVAKKIDANLETTRTALSRMSARGLVHHAKKPKRGYFVPQEPARPEE